MPDIFDELANSERAYLIAAAGCGKTHAIAQAVARSSEGCQLILTHTHAGVHSLRKRLQILHVPSPSYHIDTIAGWALRLAIAYPGTSGFSNPKPQKNEWMDVYRAATYLLGLPFMRQVIGATYKGIYVDEYQDCTVTQHALVLALAELLPCRILGDPLQGIFGFGHDPLVDWQNDIAPNFEQLPDLTTPWRWAEKNERLGQWLAQARQLIANNQPVDLNCAPLIWRASTDENRWKICMGKANSPDSVVAIHPENLHANGCHNFASQLRGNYQSIEEMEASDLMSWAKKLGCSTGNQRAIRIIEFAATCMTTVSTELRTIQDKFKDQKKSNIAPDFSKVRKYREIAASLVRASQSTNPSDIWDALRLISDINEAKMYRADLWHEMLRAIAYLSDEFTSLEDAAWHIRTQTRFVGRKEYQRIVSRTLLVKGLEFDHAVVLDADQLDAKNLYVAITRGANSLTILSEKPILNGA